MSCDGGQAPREAGAGSGGAGVEPSLRARLLGLAAANGLGALCASWRVGVSGLDRFDQALAERRRALMLFWHGKYVPLFVLLRDRRACIFSSVSERGSSIATICRHFGYECVRLPDGGGADSLERMELALREHLATGLAADGPLGPWHKVKRGPVVLASRLGFEIYPVSFAARPCLVSRSRWDRMELPLPFARVRLVVGEPMAVPRDASESVEATAAWCDRLRHALDETGAAAERALG